MTTALICGAVAVGYVLGRLRPVHRASDWANWQAYGRRPAGWRYPVVWVLLTAENLAIIAARPRQSWWAWKHRNDPPPPRSPAVALRFTNPPVPGKALGVSTDDLAGPARHAPGRTEQT